jgi:F-type H+-transporting ATPase subunit b
MSLLKPEFGLLFWMLFNFLLVFGLLAKFGFPVITKMVGERQAHIAQSLEAAAEANRQLEGIKQTAQDMLAEARRQQADVMKKAIADGEQIVRAAQQKAVDEAQKQIEQARKSIDLQKEKALSEINAQVALLSVDIAEKILRRQLSDKKAQESFIMQMIDEASRSETHLSH